MHITCLLGAAAELAASRGPWRGRESWRGANSVEEIAGIVTRLPSNHLRTTRR
jgi:hypothetical protein